MLCVCENTPDVCTPTVICHWFWKPLPGTVMQRTSVWGRTRWQEGVVNRNESL